MRRSHVIGNFLQDFFLRPGRLKWQHFQNLRANAVGQRKANPRVQPRSGSLQLQAAFQPKKLLENQSELRRTPKRVQQSQIGIGRRKVQRLDRRPQIGQFQLVHDPLRQRIRHRLNAFQYPIDQGPKNPCRDLSDSRINRNNAAGMQSIVVIGQNLELRMHDGQVSRVVIKLDLPKQRDFLPRREYIVQVRAMKPLSGEHASRSIGERSLKQPQIAPLKPGNFGRPHLSQHRRHLARRQIADRLDVAPVFIPEGRTDQQILDNLKALCLKHRRARRSDAFYVHQWSREIQGLKS